MFKNWFAILFLAIFSFSFSQESEYLYGKLVDASQNQPIPFATIRIKDKSIGVISNINGTFKIPVQFKDQGEVLEISCLGYEGKVVTIQSLNEVRSNLITLEPSVFELSEAVVSAKKKRLSAKQIVRMAVNGIPRNYPQDDFGLVGYYRDYQVKNSAYTNLNEAIIKIFDEGFGKKNSFHNEYQLLSYSQNQSFEIDPFAKRPYDYDDFTKIIPNAKIENEGGNELILLGMHDAIRNYKEESFSFINDIKSDFIRNHRFRLLGKSRHKKESVYQIEITFRDSHYVARGMIFINATDFSIHKLDYALSKLDNDSFKRKKNLDYSQVVNASERFSDGFTERNSELLYHIKTEYARGANKKMYLNYISFYNKVLIQRPPKFESKFVINLNDNSFRIRLNKLPAKLDRIKSSDFKIRYKKDLLPIAEFYFMEDERTFVVCPDLDYEKAEKLFENFNYAIADVTYKYEFKDDEGNKLDERKWEYIHQYREFFTQEIQLNATLIQERELMLKTLPLDSPKQPFSNEKFDKKYWKNTPLKGSIN